MLAVTEVVGLDRFRWIVEEQASRALKGDLAAAQWIAKLLLGTNPPPVSEVLAGMLRGGPHYAVAERLEAKDAADGPSGQSTRRERAAELAETLGDPDPPESQSGPPEPTLEDLARQARCRRYSTCCASLGNRRPRNDRVPRCPSRRRGLGCCTCLTAAIASRAGGAAG